MPRRRLMKMPIRVKLPKMSIRRPKAKYRALIKECRPFVQGIDITVDLLELGLRLVATLRWVEGYNLEVDLISTRAHPKAAKSTANLIEYLGDDLYSCLESAWGDIEARVEKSPGYQKLQGKLNALIDRIDLMEEEDTDFDFHEEVIYFAER